MVAKLSLQHLLQTEINQVENKAWGCGDRTCVLRGEEVDGLARGNTALTGVLRAKVQHEVTRRKVAVPHGSQYGFLPSIANFAVTRPRRTRR